MSSYIDSVIGTDEKVEYNAKVSIWSMLPLFLLGLILLPAYGLGIIFLDNGSIKVHHHRASNNK